MKRHTLLFATWISAALSLMGLAPRGQFRALGGPYLGQEPPGLVPEVFAPGIISTDVGEGCSGFTRDGGAFLYARSKLGIQYTELKDGRWTQPVKVSFAKPGQDGDFILAPDGTTVFFASGRPVSTGLPPLKDHNIWKTVRTESGWTEPVPLPAPVNTDAHESYPSLAKDGTLYFFSRRGGGLGQSDLYRSELVDGTYKEVTNLGPVFNTEHHEVDPFIAPDESYLIFASDRPGGFGKYDFYISFKGAGGQWLPPMNMGDKINSPFTEYIISVTLDGKYLFFTSNKNGSRDIFWVDAGIIEELGANR